MSITIYVDDRDVMQELRRLEDGPDFNSFTQFSGVMQLGLSTALLDVHRITGSLAASGKWDASVHDDNFEGSITFGGPSPGGVHDPVEYAQLEQEKRFRTGAYVGTPLRTDGPSNFGDHDFMREVPYATGSQFREVILDFFRNAS